MNDIFAKDLSGELVSPNEPGYELLIEDIFETMETADELNKVGIRDQKRVHELMGKILGKPLDMSTTLLPPLWKAGDHRQRLLHSAVLHILWSRRHHHWRRCVHRSEVQPDNHQSRCQPREQRCHIRPSHRHRRQSLDRHQFHHPSRCQNRLWSDCRRPECCNPRCTADDNCRR